MVDWEQRVEEEWGRALSMRAATRSWLPFRESPATVFTSKRSEKGGKFCTLIPPKPADERTKKDYLFLAAGCAAEDLIYKGHDEEAAGGDRKDFDLPDSPLFDGALEDASKLLFEKRRHLKRLVSMLKTKVRQVDYDLDRLPEVGMDSSDQRYFKAAW